MDGLNDSASAFGVVSFGLLVGQNLISYYKGWRSYHQDIQSSFNHISDYAETLEQLHSVLQNAALFQPHTDRVSQCLVNCADDIYQLDRQLRQLYSNHDPQGFHEAVAAKKLHLLYPFKKDTLEELDCTLDKAMKRLKVALEVLQLKTSINTFDEVKGVTTDLKLLETSNARIDQTAQRIYDLSLQSTAGITDLLQTSVADIRRWLDAPDCSVLHDESRRRYEPGTGEWFLESSEYRKFLSGEHRSLALFGTIGCGKTVLCSSIINDMQQHAIVNGQGLAYFYFSFSDKRRQNYRDLLLSLADQLCIFEPVFAILNQYKNNPISTEALERCLKVLTSTRRLSIILDGLDEVPQNDNARGRVIHGLTSLLQACETTNLFILTTSQPEDDIVEAMKNINACAVQLNQREINKDIKLYVKNEIESHHHLRGLPSDLKERIVEQLHSKADGMFRWAYCQVDELSRLRRPTPKTVASVLASLPATVDDTYERILLRISPHEQHIAIAALLWMMFATRPLRLDELEEACITSYQQTPYVDEENRADPGSVVKLMPSLLIIDPPIREASSIFDVGSDLSSENSNLESRQSTVRLAHFSIRRFLSSEKIKTGKASAFAMDPFYGHRSLAQNCFAYVIAYACNPQKESAEQLVHEADVVVDHESDNYRGFFFESFPLLGYSIRESLLHQAIFEKKANSECFDHHVGVNERDYTAWHTGLEMTYLTDDSLREFWIKVLLSDEDLELEFDGDTTPLQLAVAFGWPQTFCVLRSAQSWTAMDHDIVCQNNLESNHMANQSRKSYDRSKDRSLLYRAAINDQLEIVELIIEGMRETQLCQPCAIEALAIALGTELPHRYRIAALLLRKGVDLGQPNSLGRSALSIYAFWYLPDQYFYETLELLLEAGAKARELDQNQSVLQIAISRGCPVTVVDLLLKYGAKANADSDERGSPLLTAVFRGDIGIAKALIRRGADVNKVCEDGGHALEHALSVPVAKFLFDEGANVKLADLRTLTKVRKLRSLELERLSELLEHSGQVIELCITHGAEINMPHELGMLLLLAVYYHQLSSVEALLQQGANHFVAPSNAEARTLLGYFPPKSPEGDSFDELQGLSPLALARFMGYQDIVSILEWHIAANDAAPEDIEMIS